jgi:acyl-CoA dehydrogenase
MNLTLKAEVILKLIKAASQEGVLPHGKPEQLVEAAVAAGVLTTAQEMVIKDAIAARNDAIQVDSFTMEEYTQGVSKPEWNNSTLPIVNSGRSFQESTTSLQPM